MSPNVGFDGNTDIYGIGIRVGFYTQAMSIWVANFYAQHEAPYLHTVTLLFLMALLVGTCVYSKDPGQIFAVEPYMLMQVAYNTMYMGLWDQAPPELLLWEVHVKKRLIIDTIWLGLHGFDCWYWWSGVYQMKRTQGIKTANSILFPYVGGTDLFGWIGIPARILNSYMMVYLALDFYFVCAYSLQQKRVDRAVKPDQLLKWTAQWLAKLETEASFRPCRLEAPSNDIEVSPATDQTTIPKRPILRASAHSRCAGPVESELETSKSSSSSSTETILPRDETAPPPYHRPSRTNTGLLKGSLLRWPTFRENNVSIAPPQYTPYEPTFENLNSAVQILTSSTMPAQTPQHLQRLRKPFQWLISLFKLLPVLFTTPFRPSVSLAILSHAHNMERVRTIPNPKVLCLALKNPAYRILRAKDIALTSRILLTLHPPLPPSRWMRFCLGWGTFGACSVLVIGTELTIQWNEIRGVQQLTSVGQLIPFCLGVGGLLKVVWSAVFEREEQVQGRLCYYGRCNGKEGGLWEEIGKNFEKCCDVFEKERMEVVVVGGTIDGKYKADV